MNYVLIWNLIGWGFLVPAILRSDYLMVLTAIVCWTRADVLSIKDPPPNRSGRPGFWSRVWDR